MKKALPMPNTPDAAPPADSAEPTKRSAARSRTKSAATPAVEPVPHTIGLPKRPRPARKDAAGGRLDMARRIVALAEDKKAADILLLDLEGLTTLADAFVI